MSNPFRPNTDCHIIYEILADGEWHNGIEICQRGKPGCVNWAYRSRISCNMNPKLIDQKEIIKSRIGKNGCAEYRLEKIITPEIARQLALC